MLDAQDPRRIVAAGYDRIAGRYAEWAAQDVEDSVRARYVAMLDETLPSGVRVLELGCGGGGPTTRDLASRFVLTGVDISARQIALARERVPGATFMHTDMTEVRFPPSSFAGVAAFYSLIHLPHGELPRLLGSIQSWLRPGGILVASMGTHADEGTIEEDWLGVPMYFSSYSVEVGTHLVVQAGLEIVSRRVETILEEGRPVKFLWLVARKPPIDR